MRAITHAKGVINISKIKAPSPQKIMTININTPLRYISHLIASGTKLRVSGIAFIIASNFYTFPGEAATTRLDDYDIAPTATPIDIDNIPLFNDPKKNFLTFDSPPKEGANQYQAVTLARQGITHFQNGEYQLAITDLSRAWKMDQSIGQTGALLAFIYLKTKKYDNALEVAVTLQKTHPIGYTLTGVAHAAKGEHNKAKQAFNKAIELRPNDGNATFNLVAYAIDDGDLEKARNLYTKLLNADAGNLKALIGLSEIELKAGQPEQAIKALKTAIDKNPESLQPRLLLARYYFIAGETQKSLDISAPALVQFPNNITLLELVGVARLKAGLPEDAITTLKTAIQISPNTLTLHYNLAKAYEQLKQYNPAIQEVEIALGLNATHKPSKYLQARLLIQTGKLDEAQSLLQQLSLSLPENSDIKELEGTIALAQNRYTDAVALLNKALTGKQSSNLVILLATAQFQAGYTAESFATLENWLDKQPGDIQARAILFDILLAQGEFSKAQQQSREILRLQPNSVITLNNLAWLLAKNGELNKALIYAEKAYTLEPNNPNVLDTYGVILLRNGQTEKAERLLQSAVKKYPDSLNTQFHLAQALNQSGKPLEAKKILKNLLSQDRQFTEHQQTKDLLQELNK